MKEKKEPDLDLKIVNTETKTITIPFKKNQKKIAPTAPATPHIKLIFYNTKTEKNEDILLYNYYEHLKKFGLEWENTAIDFKFSLNLSKDEKKLIKQMTMSRETRLKLHIDESGIWNMGMRIVRRHS